MHLEWFCSDLQVLAILSQRCILGQGETGEEQVDRLARRWCFLAVKDICDKESWAKITEMFHDNFG